MSTALRVARRFVADITAGELLRRAEEVASTKLEQAKADAKAIRAAAKFLAGILTRVSKTGYEPSESKDYPKWDESVKVLQQHNIPAPDSGMLSWRD